MVERKNIFILLGNPDRETFSGALADEYERGAREAGHEIRRMNIGELQFDPILHKGYKEIQELEPDLVKVQENFKWADHIVIVYPNWWCTMPALLKGMFDRMYLPGFAFRFRKGEGYKWDKLLKGRSARVIVAAAAHPLAIRFLFGDFTNEISHAILGFAGISPVRVSTFGPCMNVEVERAEKWKEKVYELGEKGI
jgi:putative NADPH-quinone reductase